MTQQLGWKHHALIQALMSRGPLDEKGFHEIFIGITGKNPATHPQIFNDCLLKINKELAFVQFELRACRNQYNGKVYYGVINNVADEQSKLGTKYSVPQIAFYKGVIEAIVQDMSTQGCITNIEALNVRLENQVQTEQASQDSQSHVPAAFKSFSLSQKEKTLNDLIQDQWLCYTSDGKIGLGIRSFFDLRSWFRNNDIPSCDVCNEAGVKALTCPNEGCPVRLHDYCLKKKFSQQKGSRACPGCGTEWPGSQCQEEDDMNTPGQSQMTSADPIKREKWRNVKAEAVEATQAPPGPERAKRLRSCKTEAVGTAENEASPSNLRRRTRRSSRI
ncbi:Non-structural maintenance of chromosomes element [Cocos nucifera]|uniref:Non-structural maintenance of chromosomes element 1 homolog n=1 Tax=Cocos nucifera TaxID=13894 RepID=A0A8K0I5L0_COCNU|nr:Non-structural maintenance of chromosomes element [Cocos nucifera]